MTTKPVRDEKGRLLKGQSGNPNGRPRLPDWLKARGPDAIKYLVDVATGEEFAEPALRIRAAEWVVDRVYGKSAEIIAGDPDAPLVAHLRVEFVKPEKP